MNLMVGHWCPITHRLSLKDHVDINNGQLKTIKAGLRLSRHLVHALMFEVGFYFRSLTTTKSIIKEALIYLGHRCPTIRFIHTHIVFVKHILYICGFQTIFSSSMSVHLDPLRKLQTSNRFLTYIFLAMQQCCCLNFFQETQSP